MGPVGGRKEEGKSADPEERGVHGVLSTVPDTSVYVFSVFFVLRGSCGAWFKSATGVSPWEGKEVEGKEVEGKEVEGKEVEGNEES